MFCRYAYEPPTALQRRAREITGPWVYANTSHSPPFPFTVPAMSPTNPSPFPAYCKPHPPLLHGRSRPTNHLPSTTSGVPSDQTCLPTSPCICTCTPDIKLYATSPSLHLANAHNSRQSTRARAPRRDRHCIAHSEPSIKRACRSLPSSNPTTHPAIDTRDGVRVRTTSTAPAKVRTKKDRVGHGVERRAPDFRLVAERLNTENFRCTNDSTR